MKTRSGYDLEGHTILISIMDLPHVSTWSWKCTYLKPSAWVAKGRARLRILDEAVAGSRPACGSLYLPSRQVSQVHLLLLHSFKAHP